MTRRPLRDRPGLQAERTELAWERSGIGLLAAAALLLVRHVEPALGRVVLVVAYRTVALLTVWLGRMRGRQIRVPREDRLDVSPCPTPGVRCSSSAGRW